MNWTATTIEIGRHLFGVLWNPERATPAQIEAIQEELDWRSGAFEGAGDADEDADYDYIHAAYDE